MKKSVIRVLAFAPVILAQTSASVNGVLKDTTGTPVPNAIYRGPGFLGHGLGNLIETKETRSNDRRDKTH